MEVQFRIKSHPKKASGFEFPYVMGGNKRGNKPKTAAVEDTRHAPEIHIYLLSKQHVS